MLFRQLYFGEFSLRAPVRNPKVDTSSNRRPSMHIRRILSLLLQVVYMPLVLSWLSHAVPTWCNFLLKSLSSHCYAVLLGQNFKSVNLT